ncbi:VOC family protein [Vibrio spartinae]|uniref:Lactoylglutathione lyase n=1 Tax=Vibrio spartinae TaxID=1918945 RepID=A0ABX6R077_9VIBR|nr:VOC family protein [Vibrio spartinae]QMV14901.1 putative lactoylglutathione lyase [Vibrio spartinae]
MIAYTMIGTNDLEKARRFYDPVFSAMNMEICWNDESSVSYGKLKEVYFPRFFVGYPFDGKQSNVGNGSMTAFQCIEVETVDKVYEIAISKGGSCEGPPGYRPQYGEGFYAAYVRDPDGNKIAFVVY